MVDVERGVGVVGSGGLRVGSRRRCGDLADKYRARANEALIDLCSAFAFPHHRHSFYIDQLAFTFV